VRNLRRFAVLAVIAAGCASPLTVAENRDAAASSGGGPQFNPATPNDGSFDAFDDPVSLADPPGDGGPD
jgi:hypothetical protein